MQKITNKILKILTSRILIVGLFLLLQICVIVAAVYLVYFVDNVWLSFALNVAFELLTIIVAFYIVNTRVNPAYKITWFLVITLLSFVGVLFYILFANKKFTKKQQRKYSVAKANMKINAIDKGVIDELEKKDDYVASTQSKYIQDYGDVAIFKNSKVTYYPLGDDAFPVIVEELKKAKHYIFLEYFIIQEGLFWDSMLDVLKDKAKEGVEIRMIYDDLGCISTLPSRYYLKMREAGIQCYSYNKLRPIVDVRMNNRDHRKILVIDGHTGFTGGINLADEYINKTVKYGHWKDNAIMIKGEAVYGLTSLFLCNWSLVSSKPIDFDGHEYERYKSELGMVENDGYVQPYGDIPFDYESVGESVYLNMINAAQKYIYITTPYLIIDNEMQTALTLASKRGVKIYVLTPHIPDKKIVFGVTRSYYLPLLESGIEVYEYTPGFVHAKMFVVDDRYATVGTINLDYRSLYLHSECGVWLHDCSCILDMKNDFEDTLKVSSPYIMKKFPGFWKRIWLGIVRAFAPLM